MSDPCVILVIDDNPGDSDLVREALEHVSFDGAVVSVENAPQAFEYLAGRGPYASLPRPDIVLLDLNMPVLNGFDVLREIKARPDWAAINVVVLSSSRAPLDQTRAQRMGALRFITKPKDWTGYLAVAKDVQDICRCAA